MVRTCATEENAVSGEKSATGNTEAVIQAKLTAKTEPKKSPNPGQNREGRKVIVYKGFPRNGKSISADFCSRERLIKQF
jgi:hypothetical protein